MHKQQSIYYSFALFVVSGVCIRHFGGFFALALFAVARLER